MRIQNKFFDKSIQKAQLLLIERDPKNNSGLLSLAGFDSEGLVLSDEFHQRYGRLRTSDALWDYLNDVARFVAGKPFFRVAALTDCHGQLYPRSALDDYFSGTNNSDWAMDSRRYERKK